MCLIYRTDSDAASVKERISQFTGNNNSELLTSEYSKPKRQRPTSKAYEMFESQGIMIGQAPDSLAQTFPGKSPHTDSLPVPEDELDGLSPDGTPRNRSPPVPRPRSQRKGSAGKSATR